VKVCITDTNGRTLGESGERYETYAPRVGWAEQDPEEWMKSSQRAYLRAMDAADSSAGERVTVHGIGVTGQMHSFVLLDAEGNVLRPAITWLDSRARDLVPEITERLQRAGLYQKIANKVAPGLTLSPLVWLAKNEPDVLERASTLLIPKDYLRYRLTGERWGDPTDASATLLFDVAERRWLPEVCELFGISPAILPELLNTWEVAGQVQEQVQSEWRCEHRTVVAAGAADQQAGALATGVITPGQVQFMIGTGSQIASPTDRTDHKLDGSLNFFCHHTNWLLQGSLQNAGSALTWVEQVLNADISEILSSAGEQNADDSPFFLPYLTGERTPIMDEKATGSWLKLRQGNTRRDLMYSAIEGVVFSMCDAFEAIAHTLHLESDAEIRAGGGGTKAPAYIQLVSDALGRPLSILPDASSSAIGAAILAGVAAGDFASIGEGSTALGLRSLRTTEPDKSRHERLLERRGERTLLRDSQLASNKLASNSG